MKYIYVLLKACLLLCFVMGGFGPNFPIFPLKAQEAKLLKGQVLGEANQPLVGVAVYWPYHQDGVTTNEEGFFELPFYPNAYLVVSYIGYQQDSIYITQNNFISHQLQPDLAFSDVEVESKRVGIYTNDGIVKENVITQDELKKAACCDLSGCFETEATVQPQVTNMITQSKELRMLGLAGVYNQVLFEGLPGFVNGLSYTYGLSTYPGPLIQNIFVAQGANSVIQGHEGMSGQINLEVRMPDTNELFLNTYVNSFGEQQYNVQYAATKGNWKSMTAVHWARPGGRFDHEGDGFMNVPLISRQVFFHQSAFDYDQGEVLAGLRFSRENRVGGQIDYEPDEHKGGREVYGQYIDYLQPEMWLKWTHQLGESWQLNYHWGGQYHQQDANFGLRKYEAEQWGQYHRLGFTLDKKRSQLRLGGSFRHFQINESVDNILFHLPVPPSENPLKIQRTDQILGAYAEYEYDLVAEKLSVMGGYRIDHHQDFGAFGVPRLLVKWNSWKNADFRFSAGRSWRIPNVLSENVFLLAGNRNLYFQETILPEEAWTWGVNYTQDFEVMGQAWSLGADFYQVLFSRQFFPDMDRRQNAAFINNGGGAAQSNSLHLHWSAAWSDRIATRLSYTYLDVYTTIDGEKRTLPFNHEHKLLGVVSYQPLHENWQLDVNVHWYGEQRLPDLKDERAFSEPFTLLNAQFSYDFKWLEVYTGVENILDFRQNFPIRSWEQPFGPLFDPSYTWGPTRGREFYLGLRKTL